MRVYEKLAEIDVGETISPKHNSKENHKDGFVITKKELLYDNGNPVDSGLSEEWVIINKKIKVTIDGQEGYISKESAEELKRMLNR
jgi:hypothetical protein